MKRLLFACLLLVTVFCFSVGKKSHFLSTQNNAVSSPTYTTPQVEQLWYSRYVPDTFGINRTFQAYLNKNDSNQPQSFVTPSYVNNIGRGWALTGNSITQSEYIGTNNKQQFSIRVNNNVITTFDTSSFPFNTSGLYNIFIGLAQPTGVTGEYNTLIGDFADEELTTGDANTVGGWNAANGNTTGSNNSIWGKSSISRSPNPNNNSCIGDMVMYSVTGNNNCNTVNGYRAGAYLMSAFGCIFDGDSAGCARGYNPQHSIAIGYQAASLALYNNCTVIGWLTEPKGDNTAVMDDSLVTDFYETGNLHVQGNSAIILPVQESSSTTSVTSTGAQILDLSSSTLTAITITDPPHVNGQLWEVTCQASSVIITWANGSHFASATATVTPSAPLRYYWNANQGIWKIQ